MPSLYAEIDIDAPKSAVWQALIRKDHWVEWNTFLFDCDPSRPFQRGRNVLLSTRRLPGDEETEFEPRITRLQPEVCLRWKTRVPGFQSDQIFELQEIGMGRTKYFHGERFSGPLSTLFLPFIRRDEQQGVRRMARELKRYVEWRISYDRNARRYR